MVDGDNAVLLDTILFDPQFRGGGALAVIPATDTDGRVAGVPGIADTLLARRRSGGTNLLRLSSGSLTVADQFFALQDPNYRGGLQVSAADGNGDGRPDAGAPPGRGWGRWSSIHGDRPDHASGGGRPSSWVRRPCGTGTTRSTRSGARSPPRITRWPSPSRRQPIDPDDDGGPDRGVPAAGRAERDLGVRFEP